MAFDQSKLFKKLENIVSGLNKEEFVYDFLLAFGSPKATITKLKNSYGSAGSLLDESVVLKNKIHFQTCEPTQNLHTLCESTKKSSHISKDKIRFIIVTDFEDVVAYDTKAKDTLDIEFIDLPKSYAFFLPLAGIEKFEVTSEHPADVKASYKMGQLCDVIRRHNQIDTEEKIHAFNVFLTRLLFCFYAEDTGIFDENQMIKAIQNTTEKSGKALKTFFETFFKVLNLPKESTERTKLPNHFTDFPYVNGGLFSKEEWIPEFTDKARRMIIEIGALNWDEINPDIFGSMFQAVIDPEQRGSLGQHYTSVPNIMKVIRPLFIDELEDELDRSRNNAKKLQKLLLRLQEIRFFDPACGSGNFLIISYKEIRKLEMKVFKALDALGEQSVMFISGIRLNQFYGIEIDDFAHEIALLSLWLAENQMNKLFKDEFGYMEPMLPLKESGNVICGNSLDLDWNDVCSNGSTTADATETYVFGNPPFLGARIQTSKQKEDLARIFNGSIEYKDCDYVSGWLIKGSQFISSNSNARCAFVSTNSVCQGEQVGHIWSKIIDKTEILFAHQSFKWSNNAQNKAAVICVIVGFGKQIHQKRIFTDESFKIVKNISPYLFEGNSLIVFPRNTSVSPDRNKLAMGSMPRDGGHLIMTEEEKQNLVNNYPESKDFIKPLYGAKELLSSAPRYALWIENEQKDKAEQVPEIKRRIQSVYDFRIASKAKTTNQYAKIPHMFAQRTEISKRTIIIPSVSSERRHYIPIGYFEAPVISSNANFVLNNSSLYEFGILTSEIHNDWMRTIAGRLESRYRYSASIVYNNFPWPDVSDKQIADIEKLAEEVLLVRSDHTEKTLAQMYDPEKMPEDLREAHKELDIAVERLYRNKPFENEAERVEFLFKRYEELISKEGNNA